MAKYRIAWLPGDGVGVDVLDAAKIVLDRLALEAEYVHGDIGWDFWCREGDALPARTVDLLKNVDAALFGAITSKPVKEAEKELAPELKGKGLVYRSPIVRMRQLGANIGMAIVRPSHTSPFWGRSLDSNAGRMPLLDDHKEYPYFGRQSSSAPMRYPDADQ